ncbi:MAG TPA: hypothetical protein VGM99_00780, partial [Candidatus Cybelea sp.]
MYAVTDTATAYVFNYPKGTLSQTLTFSPSGGTGSASCSDSSGDVFIGASTSSPTNGTIYEFSHGGTSPVATLTNGPYAAFGCSVDPSSEDLAVVNNPVDACTSGGNVSVYPGGQEPPKIYTVSAGFECYSSASFDGNGDLFVAGRSPSDVCVLAELPKGSSNFVAVNLSRSITDTLLCRIQWDGTDLAIVAPGSTKRSSAVLYRFHLSGSTGTLIGTTRFAKLHGVAAGSAFIISGRLVTL